MTKKTGFGLTAQRVILGLGGVIMVFPFFWMISSSLKNDVEAFSTPPTLWPKDLTFKNYANLFETLDMGQLVLNSVFVSAFVVILQLLTSALAGYAFAKIDFRFKSAVFVMYLVTMMVPMQVIVVPLFIEMRQLNLIDTLFGLGLPMIASAFGAFFMRQAMLAVPNELTEAATIDGAGQFRIFWKIALPLTTPSLSALAVLSFMSTWNAFLWPLLVIYSPENMTLPLGLANLHGQYSTDWPMVMAGTTISVIPIALVYLVLQRQITQSFLTAGLKG